MLSGGLNRISTLSFVGPLCNNKCLDHDYGVEKKVSILWVM